MAFEVIKTYDLYNYSQEEVTEVKNIAGADGVVTEVETVLQQGVSIQAKLIVSQDVNRANNYSNLTHKIVCYVTNGAKGNDINISSTVDTGVVPDYTNDKRKCSYLSLSNRYVHSGLDGTNTYTIAPGETKEIVITYLNLTHKSRVQYRYDDYYLSLYHNLDGTLTHYLSNWRNAIGEGYGFSAGASLFANEYLQGRFYIYTSGIITDGVAQGSTLHDAAFNYDYPTEAILSNNKSVAIATASNFTDEEAPGFTYKAEPQYSLYFDSRGMAYNLLDTVSSFQASLSFDGENEDISYRDIPIDSTSYTFSLTDAERELLRQKAQGSNSVPIYYLTRTNRKDNDNRVVLFNDAVQRILTIVGSEPTLNPTVVDIKPETIALTGNPNIFVRYESMVEFSTGAVASKHATIVSQSVQNGSKVVYNLYNGVIDDIESNSFIFNATDSRGLHAEQVVITNTAMIPYVVPTCKQEVAIEMSGEIGAVVTIKLSGNYYNGSFGAVDNTLTLQARYAAGSNDMGDWITLSGSPKFNNDKYELTATFSGLSYAEGYTFQCRAIDKLNTVNSAEYVTKLLPVFDWSEEDFNFNVPIKMNGETVLRHNEAANNTVLSASGGYIYLRPGGTDDTSGQTIIYPNGSIEFGGSVDFGSSFTIGGYELADYVIEAGEDTMGSNGTWYWRKWASGKAECWGCRNYGRMAVTTAWGNLYRSEIFTQDLPDNVFARTPDVIDINIVNSTFGGWICKHENTAPSAITTGSFIFTRPASATNTISYIGFYVIGEWK